MERTVADQGQSVKMNENDVNENEREGGTLRGFVGQGNIPPTMGRYHSIGSSFFSLSSSHPITEPRSGATRARICARVLLCVGDDVGDLIKLNH
jgi:hypothetical protein